MTTPDVLTEHQTEMEGLLARLDAQLEEMQRITSDKEKILEAHRSYYREQNLWGVGDGNA